MSAGSYSLTAKAVYDAGSTVASLPVNVTVTPSGTGGVLFSDNFSSGALSPWVSELGTWTVANGALNGSSPLNSFGYAYISTNGWSNYTVQASIRFSMTNGPWAGGIGGRLNPTTGARYAAWVYPEGSGGGSAVIKLVKWEGWTSWGGTPMALASLPGVGTNWHTVALAFQGTNLTVSYDGVQEISVTDNDFDSVAPYSSGGITADLWTYQAPFTLFVANVLVTALTVTNPAPTLALTSPLNGANYTAPATITLAASVTANGHSITQVQYYNGPTLLGANTSAPYSLTWTNVRRWQLHLTAQAVYDAGSTVASSPVNVTVTNPPPALALTSPLNGASYTAPTDHRPCRQRHPQRPLNHPGPILQRGDAPGRKHLRALQLDLDQLERWQLHPHGAGSL